MKMRYPSGIIMALLSTEFMTPITSEVLAQRIEKAKTTQLLFFDVIAFEILSVVCDRLMAQDSKNRILNVAVFIDERLSNNTCDGWRYDNMPPDDQLYLRGIKGIEELAQQLFACPFIDLSKKDQMEIISSLHDGTAKTAVWQEMSAELFFEEILAETTEIFYSFPLVQEEIGYVGMADAKGWSKIGLDEKNDIEPVPINFI